MTHHDPIMCVAQPGRSPSSTPCKKGKIDQSTRCLDDVGCIPVKLHTPISIGIQSYRTSGSVRLDPPGTYITVPPITVPEKVRLDP